MVKPFLFCLGVLSVNSCLVLFGASKRTWCYVPRHFRVRVFLLVCVFCLSTNKTQGCVLTGARRQGALAPQLPRATRSSEFKSEVFFSDFEFFNPFFRFSLFFFEMLFWFLFSFVCLRPKLCKTPWKTPSYTPHAPLLHTARI